MERRVMGEEWETAILEIPKKTSTVLFSSKQYQEAFFECLPEGLYGKNVPAAPRLYLTNGGVIYVDTGNHVEYGTPEGSTPAAVVIYAKNGEAIISEMVSKANKHPEFQNAGLTLAAFKNNTSQNGESYGTHENYLVRRNDHTKPDYELLWRIGWFLGARMAFTGNGLFGINKKGKIRFTLSQRIHFMRYGVGKNTTAERGIIDVRDEPFADENKYRRLHIIAGDATIFQAATHLKFGMTDLVLDALEEGYIRHFPFGKFSDEEIIGGLREYAADPSLRLTYQRLTVIDRLERYFEIVSAYYQKFGNLTPERKKILEIWEKGIAAARSGNPAHALSRIAGWAAKLTFVRNDAVRRKYDWNDPSHEISIPIRRGGECINEDKRTVFFHAKSLDYQFDRIYPRGIALLLEEKGYTDTIATAEDIARVRTRPIPGDTRADARAQELAWIFAVSEGSPLKNFSADWTHIIAQFPAGDGVWISHKDPFDATPFPHSKPE